jgi:hypothetical protein
MGKQCRSFVGGRAGLTDGFSDALVVRAVVLNYVRAELR